MARWAGWQRAGQAGGLRASFGAPAHTLPALPRPPPQVYKGRRKCTGQITAMKFIMKHGKSEKDIKNLRQEIEILRTLRHENIIQMLDSFETKTDFCVVTGGRVHACKQARMARPTRAPRAAPAAPRSLPACLPVCLKAVARQPVPAVQPRAAAVLAASGARP